MSPPLGVIAAIGVVLATMSPANAEFLRAPDGNPLIGPDGNMIHITKLEASCGPALDRFCPELTVGPGQTTNEIICLKPFRANLSLNCRKLVEAAKN